MRIIIKIQSIEINVETDETAAAPAITAATTQAIEQMITPLVPTRARKTRTTEATPAVSLPRKGVVEPQVVTIPAATNGHDEAESAEETPKTEEPQTPESSKKRLPFEEFDRLVRAEIKRLAPSPGQMPSHNLWNEMRTPPLPTLGAVISRYDCVDLNGLAKELGMNPPLGKPGPVPAKALMNGAA